MREPRVGEGREGLTRSVSTTGRQGAPEAYAPLGRRGWGRCVWDPHPEGARHVGEGVSLGSRGGTGLWGGLSSPRSRAPSPQAAPGPFPLPVLRPSPGDSCDRTVSAHAWSAPLPSAGPAARLALAPPPAGGIPGREARGERVGDGRADGLSHTGPPFPRLRAGSSPPRPWDPACPGTAPSAPTPSSSWSRSGSRAACTQGSGAQGCAGRQGRQRCGLPLTGDASELAPALPGQEWGRQKRQNQ